MPIKVAALLCSAVLLFSAARPNRAAPVVPPVQQTENTLVGEWILSFTAINGLFASPLGNTIGFADRDITFQIDSDLQTAVVKREDLSPIVQPLGAWQIQGDQFSSVFELFCEPGASTCGTVILRGTFTSPSKVSGTATVFFDDSVTTTPTGYDTWTMAFTGHQVAGG